MRLLPAFVRNLAALLILALMSHGGMAQTLYKSVGADGSTVYSDKPPSAGAADKTVQLDQLPVSVVPAPAATPAPRTTSAEPTTAAAPRGEVVLYMATWCGYCRAAKAYLASKQIAYREFDVDTPAGKAAFQQISGRGVPVLLAQGQRVNGFSAQSYDALFVARK